MKTKMMSRRNYSMASALGLASLSFGTPSLTPTRKVNKRDAVLSLLNENNKQTYIPAGFFIHFGKKYKVGDAAINRHLQYFRAIDMDFVKVQFEKQLPKMPEITKPSDWNKIPVYKKDYFEEPLYVVKGLVERAKKEAPVIVTLYSPYMLADQATSDEVRTQHFKEDPEALQKAMEILTESASIFAKECIKLGVDGFLTSTQGGEGYRFEDKSIFEKYIKPYDLALMNQVNDACNCNILHICDHHGDYDDLSAFVDYPGQAVNCCLNIGEKRRTPSYISEKLNRPFMGGMEKRGIMATGSTQEIQQEVSTVLANASDKFMLGSSCTLPWNVDWKKVRAAVDVAHNFYG